MLFVSQLINICNSVDGNEVFFDSLQKFVENFFELEELHSPRNSNEFLNKLEIFQVDLWQEFQCTQHQEPKLLKQNYNLHGKYD